MSAKTILMTCDNRKPFAFTLSGFRNVKNHERHFPKLLLGYFDVSIFA